MKTKLLAKGAALAAALVLSLVLQAFAAERINVDPGNSPSLGPPGAPVQIIEFVDYQ